MNYIENYWKLSLCEDEQIWLADPPEASVWLTKIAKKFASINLLKNMNFENKAHDAVKLI